MEVLKDNFCDVVAEVERHIQESDFVSFDTELTGIDLNKETRLDFLDEPAERYAKVRSIAQAFAVIQLGLATFRYRDDGDGGVEVQQYTFYVFQRAYNGRWPDVRFTCQSTSIDFLARHGMDFNKVFHGGVSYLTREQEASVRREIDAAHERRATGTSTSTAASTADPITLGDQQAMIDAMHAQVDAWLDGSDGERPGEVVLGAGNAFQRKLQYQELERRYSGRGLAWSAQADPATPGRKRIVVRKTGGDEQAEAAAARREAVEAVDKAVGLRRVVEAAMRAKRLVGHNVLTDLLICYNQFLGALPSTYAEFKALVTAEFPAVYDTKYLASALADVRADFQMAGTALGDVYARVQAAPYPRLKWPPAPPDSAHNAGWDAWATGVVFAELACAAAGGDTTRAALETAAIVTTSNRMFCMRSDYPYLALDGQDPAVDRGGVVHVAGFAADTKTSQLLEAFRDAGAAAQIKWIDDTSAFAIIRDPSMAPAAMTRLNERGDLVVCAYADYRSKQEEGERPAKRARPDATAL